MCRPEDFIVTEIDTTGRLVQLDNFTLPPAPPTPPPTDSSSALDTDQSVDKATRSRPDVSEVPPLNELTTEEQYKSLSELAERVKKDGDATPSSSVCLGEITVDVIRVFLPRQSVIARVVIEKGVYHSNIALIFKMLSRSTRMCSL